MTKSLFWFIPLAFLILTGCGEEATEQEILDAQCDSNLCWELSKTSMLRTNNIPIADRLNREEIRGWRFPTTVGRTYTVRVKVASGRINTYVSSNALIDAWNNELTDRYSDDGVTFIAVGNEYYIALQDGGSTQGSQYSVRIISTDENLDPLDGTISLFVNDVPQSFRLVQDEVLRFMFDAVRGEDYTIRVAVSGGSVDTVLSRIPSVDGDVFELSGIDSNNNIPFRAAQTGRYYVAVIDTGNPTGADIAIEIDNP